MSRVECPVGNVERGLLRRTSAQRGQRPAHMRMPRAPESGLRAGPAADGHALSTGCRVSPGRAVIYRSGPADPRAEPSSCPGVRAWATCWPHLLLSHDCPPAMPATPGARPMSGHGPGLCPAVPFPPCALLSWVAGLQGPAGALRPGASALGHKGLHRSPGCIVTC